MSEYDTTARRALAGVRAPDEIGAQDRAWATVHAAYSDRPMAAPARSRRRSRSCPWWPCSSGPSLLTRGGRRHADHQPRAVHAARLARGGAVDARARQVARLQRPGDVDRVQWWPGQAPRSVDRSELVAARQVPGGDGGEHTGCGRSQRQARLVAAQAPGDRSTVVLAQQLSRGLPVGRGAAQGRRRREWRPSPGGAGGADRAGVASRASVSGGVRDAPRRGDGPARRHRSDGVAHRTSRRPAARAELVADRDAARGRHLGRRLALRARPGSAAAHQARRRGPVQGASVSPDGRWLAVVSGASGTASAASGAARRRSKGAASAPQLQLADLTAPARPPRTVLSGIPVTQPTWAPNSRWLLVTWAGADQLWFVRATGRTRVIAESRVGAKLGAGGRSGPLQLDGWCCGT